VLQYDTELYKVGVLRKSSKTRVITCTWIKNVLYYA
jgi:hypothetical protein